MLRLQKPKKFQNNHNKKNLNNKIIKCEQVIEFA